MGKDKYEALGPLYGDVGGELANIVGGDPDGAFLYAEAGEGWLGASVFKDEGMQVRYFDPSRRLCDLLFDAWETESPNPSMRWSVMEYQITGTKFDVQFRFPDEVAVKSFDGDRREGALKKRFGDKPVIYPPPPVR
jgi:hypothetical protein